MTDSRSTIRDVAKEAGVSIAAVSFFLNDTGSIGPEVRERIASAVAKLGYRRNQAARAMRTGSRGVYGLVLPDLTNPFFPGLAQAFEFTARRSGFSVLLVDSDNGRFEREGLERLDSQRVDGICWCPSTTRDIPREAGIGAPVVLIDRALPGYDVVSSDVVQGAGALGDELAGRGAHAVGIFSGPHDIPGSRERSRALRQAFGSRGLAVRWEVATPYSLELSEEATAMLRRPEIDTLVCASDVIAIAALRALKRFRHAVPKRISVYGFDNIMWSELVTPALTTMSQSVAGMGEAAVQLLADRLRLPKGDTKRLTIPMTLVRRSSSR